MWILGLSVGFLALVVVAWWRGSVLARVAAVGLALAMFIFCQPVPYRALRRAVEVPDSARVTINPLTQQPATPYESGLFTMYEATRRDVAQDIDFRFLAVGVLAVLALVPGRRSRGTAGDTTSAAAALGGSADEGAA